MRKGELKKVEQLIQRANKLANTMARAQLDLVAAINRLDETVAKVLTSPDPVPVPLAGAVKLQRQEQKIRDFAARYGGVAASALTKAHADFERERAERAQAMAQTQARKTYDASEVRESSEPLKKGAQAMRAALRGAGAVRGGK